ncbi:MAG: enoyl-CoA hydratase/isomerase family protein [Gordonia sp. (in: high G+C Gram-positive bacteria)]
MSDEGLRVERRGDAVAILQIDRPGRMNALDDALLRRLPEVLRGLARDKATRAVVLTGRGPAFSAGGDLDDLGPRLSAGVESARQMMVTYHEVVRAIGAVDVPVLAAVDGACAGAGVSLAAACDIVVAGRSVRFTPAFTKVGLVPDLGALHFWLEALGPRLAKEFAMLGEPMTAQSAHTHGLVNHVVDDGAALDVAVGLATRLSSGPSASYAMIKSIVNAASSKSRDDVLALEAFAQAAAFRTSEFEDGIQAFRERRPAVFADRQVGSR